MFARVFLGQILGHKREKVTQECAPREREEDMNYTIKAIETRYKGHLFRSQLEATWAALPATFL